MEEKKEQQCDVRSQANFAYKSLFERERAPVKRPRLETNIEPTQTQVRPERFIKSLEN